MRLKLALMRIAGQIEIPRELLETKEPLLLHVSDTPSQIYGELSRFLRKLRPDITIHTGDLSDCVKLEKNPGLLSEHTREARKILRILEQGTKQRVYVTLGNHDDRDVVEAHLTRGEILEEDRILRFGGRTLRAHHYGEALLESPADFNLYGHNFEVRTRRRKGRHFLNGVEGIHVITLQTFRVYTLSYPWMTNDYRYRRRGVGL